MRVAIVHYHLRTGGVTRVLRNTVEALEGTSADTLVLTGEPPPKKADFPPRFRVVDGLGYQQEGHSQDLQDLIAALRHAAKEGFGAAPDLWHFHNHSLGKNLALPRVIRYLAESGEPVLLQIHDFPEDGRPANYKKLLQHLGDGDPERLSDQIYPIASHVHYAVINHRDQNFLSDAGVPGACLHWLPNPVALDLSGQRLAVQKDPPLWLYPTRAIRRKNLGEFLLWAAINKQDARFATTQAPENLLERPAYERWVRIARLLKLPVTFELGTASEQAYVSLLRSAAALVTTSIAEGFGLAFLEPWWVGRPVAGRNLPEITHEFQSLGVGLNGLYDRLDIPCDWIRLQVLKSKIRSALKRSLQAYGRAPEGDTVERALSAFIVDDRVDFGRLDEAMQARIIHRVVASPDAKKSISPNALSIAESSPIEIIRNQHTVQREFSLESYGHRLTQIYRELVEAKAGPIQALSGKTLLDRFLAPERLHLLRT